MGAKENNSRYHDVATNDIPFSKGSEYSKHF